MVYGQIVAAVATKCVITLPKISIYIIMLYPKPL